MANKKAEVAHERIRKNEAKASRAALVLSKRLFSQTIRNCQQGLDQIEKYEEARTTRIRTIGR